MGDIITLLKGLTDINKYNYDEILIKTIKTFSPENGHQRKFSI